MTDTKRLSRDLFSLVLLLTGCSVATVVPEAGSGPSANLVTGTVTYRERIALPPTAVVTVRLVDVSLADAPSVLVAVQVRIEDGGKLLFISDTMNPVITRSAPTRVDIVVRRI